MSLGIIRILLGYIKRDLEQLDQMRCELKDVFREYHAAMSKIEAERNSGNAALNVPRQQPTDPST